MKDKNIIDISWYSEVLYYYKVSTGGQQSAGAAPFLFAVLSVMKTANVKQNFTLLGKHFFTSYGKQIFTLYGKEFFT